VGFDGLIDEVFCAAVDLLTKLVLLQQVAKGQDRCLIRDPVADQLDAGKATHGGHLDQGLLQWLGRSANTTAAADESAAAVANG